MVWVGLAQPRSAYDDRGWGLELFGVFAGILMVGHDVGAGGGDAEEAAWPCARGSEGVFRFETHLCQKRYFARD